MGKQVIISKNDYDTYCIPVSFKLLSRRKINSHIKKELEKKHPCYSERFITLIRYRFKKWKLTADVAVVDKAILEQAREDGSIGNIRLEDRKLKGNKYRSILFIFIFCLFILTCVTGLLTGLKKEKTVVETEYKDNFVLKDRFPDCQEVTDLTLQRVYQNGGSIESFVWKEASCRFIVYGCKPEEIVFDRGCSVSYRNGEPVFTVDFQIKREAENTFSYEEYSKAGMFQKALRSAVTDLGGLIQSEELENKKTEMSFFISHEKLGSVLNGICKTTNENFWHETGLRIVSEINGCTVYASFSSGISENGSVCQILASYFRLFKQKEFVPLRPLNQKIIPELSRSPEKLSLLGRIRRNDGTYYSFYRDRTGKILKEIE